jgi:hypothetical protein
MLAVDAAEGPAQPLSHVVAYSWFPNHRRGLPAALITCGASIGKIALAPGSPRRRNPGCEPRP